MQFFWSQKKCYRAPHIYATRPFNWWQCFPKSKCVASNDTTAESIQKAYDDYYQNTLLEEDLIIGTITDMIQKGHVDRIVFGADEVNQTFNCKGLSHLIATNRTTYEAFNKSDCNIKIVFTKTLQEYGEIIGLRWY